MIYEFLYTGVENGEEMDFEEVANQIDNATRLGALRIGSEDEYSANYGVYDQDHHIVLTITNPKDRNKFDPEKWQLPEVKNKVVIHDLVKGINLDELMRKVKLVPFEDNV